VSHEQSGFALFSCVARPIAEAFFDDVSAWPEWATIHNKIDAQFLKERVEQAREEARKWE